jgi:hypothetical protein
MLPLIAEFKPSLAIKNYILFMHALVFALCVTTEIVNLILLSILITLSHQFYLTKYYKPLVSRYFIDSEKGWYRLTEYGELIPMLNIKVIFCTSHLVIIEYKTHTRKITKKGLLLRDATHINTWKRIQYQVRTHKHLNNKK